MKLRGQHDSGLNLENQMHNFCEYFFGCDVNS